MSCLSATPFSDCVSDPKPNVFNLKTYPCISNVGAGEHNSKTSSQVASSPSEHNAFHHDAYLSDHWSSFSEVVPFLLNGRLCWRMGGCPLRAPEHEGTETVIWGCRLPGSVYRWDPITLYLILEILYIGLYVLEYWGVVLDEGSPLALGVCGIRRLQTGHLGPSDNSTGVYWSDNSTGFYRCKLDELQHSIRNRGGLGGCCYTSCC